MLQFVLQTNPGSLYISVVDDTAITGNSSSSSSDAAYYLDLLQLLLTPLQVPVLVTQDSRLHYISPVATETNMPTVGKIKSEMTGGNDYLVMQAAARNAALEPYFGGRAADSCLVAPDAAAANGVATATAKGGTTEDVGSSGESISDSGTSGVSALHSADAAADSSSSSRRRQRSVLISQERTGRALFHR